METEQGHQHPTDQRHTPGISSNPRFTTLRSETDSFTLYPEDSLPTDLQPGSPEAELVTLMKQYGMPRDPRTWQHWPDIFFPHSSRLPNGWTRLWDKTAHKIVFYRVLDGLIQHTQSPKCATTPAGQTGAGRIGNVAKQELLVGCY